MKDSAFAILKKNAAWYSLTILVTGFTAFAGVALTKRVLPDGDFIQFSLQLSATLVINVFALGWFSQGMNRFYHKYHQFFTAFRIAKIAILSGIAISIPVFLVWYFVVKANGNLYWPLCYILINAVQTTLLVSKQASLEARQAALSELLRSGSLLVLLMIPVLSGWIASIEYYWICYLMSGLLTIVLLIALSPKTPGGSTEKQSERQQEPNPPLRELLAFGLPLSGWLFITFVWTYADRWYLIRKEFPLGLSADYVAIADIMMRGTGFMFAPIVSSAYPILSRLFDSKERSAVNKLIRKVLLYEAALLGGVVVAFLALHQIVVAVLEIRYLKPEDVLKIGIGLMVIHGMFQMSAIVHKMAEMHLKTHLLVVGGAIATCIVYSLLYIIIKPGDLTSVVICFSVGFIFYMIYCLGMQRILNRKSAINYYDL